MLTIHPPSFIETEDCDGPRYIRGQPSRETPGVLMTEIQDKYITEFELPYRNIERYIKEIGNNWNRLDDKQRAVVKQSFQSMGMMGKLESFTKERFGDVTDMPTSTPTGTPAGPGPVDPNVANFIKFLALKPTDNTKTFMDTLWYSTPEQKLQLGLTKEQMHDIRDSMYQWSVDNTYVLHSNWRSGLLLFFFLLIIIILIIVAATGSDNIPTAKTVEFGKSLFGRKF
jgi:hypothetical protein